MRVLGWHYTGGTGRHHHGDQPAAPSSLLGLIGPEPPQPSPRLAMAGQPLPSGRVGLRDSRRQEVDDERFRTVLPLTYRYQPEALA